MEYRPLGNSDIRVSEICLGSMTCGTQNSEAEAHAQIEYAHEHGVNFIDTAELYPATPMSASTTGRTEEIIGSWLRTSGRRDQVVIARHGIQAPNSDIKAFVQETTTKK